MTQQQEEIRNKIENILKSFEHPTLEKNLVEMGVLVSCAVKNRVLHLLFRFPFVWNSVFRALQEVTNSALKAALEVSDVVWEIEYDIATIKPTSAGNSVKNVKNVIVVSSGKGGVGKSTTAVNLALALAHEGAKVGLLDADIYGPSIPTMLGSADQKPTSPDGEHIEPVVVYNLQTNSIGYLAGETDAMVWRGPMAAKALLQIVQDTAWRELDYLVVDMPPGTGDIQLSLAQNIPVSGALVVTTPQDVALNDATKGVVMFEKVNVPVIGIVENMSYYICENCGHHSHLFGLNGAEKLAKKRHYKVLAQLPLNAVFCEDVDKGTPTVARAPESKLGQLYLTLADRVSAELFWRGQTVPSDIPVKFFSE